MVHWNEYSTWGGGGGRAQNPVLCVKEPKNTGVGSVHGCILAAKPPNICIDMLVGVLAVIKITITKWFATDL